MQINCLRKSKLNIDKLITLNIHVYFHTLYHSLNAIDMHEFS